jgi:hypothetical protein
MTSESRALADMCGTIHCPKCTALVALADVVRTDTQWQCTTCNSWSDRALRADALLAAAPAMLAALKAAERALVACYGEPAGVPLESKRGREAIETVRAAIAAAEGKAVAS